MKCHEIRAKIPAYLERTLSPADRTYVQLHLKECHECQMVMLSYASAQNRAVAQQELNQNLKKTGFKPKRSGIRSQDVQTRLQAAGLIAPMTVENREIPETKQAAKNDQEELVENSGEELMRKHMLAMLAAKEETIEEIEPEDNPSYGDEVELSAEQPEPEFQWTREMSLETAMSGGFVEESKVAEIEETDPVANLPLSTTINWQDDPDQFVEIPYIHPVTRSEVLRKVRRNSMEGIFFLESEAEKVRETESKREADKLPFETIAIQEIARPVIEANRAANHEPTPAEIAKERLLRQIAETELPGGISTKARTMNQLAKVLPFRENTKKQAVLYRFFTIVLLLLLSLMIFLLWQNQGVSFWNNL